MKGVKKQMTLKELKESKRYDMDTQVNIIVQKGQRQLYLGKFGDVPKDYDMYEVVIINSRERANKWCTEIFVK